MISDSENSDLIKVEEDNELTPKQSPDSLGSPKPPKQKKPIYLVKKLKLKTKVSSSTKGKTKQLDSVEPAEPRCLVNQYEIMTPYVEDKIDLIKSASETDIQEPPRTYAAMTAPNTPNPIMNRASTIEACTSYGNYVAPLERVKSLENLMDVPSYGEIIAGVRLVNNYCYCLV